MPPPSMAIARLPTHSLHVPCAVQAEHAVTLLEGGVEDAGLQLNLLVLLGTLGEASGETAQLVLDAGGMEALLARADPQASEQLQEAAADGVCKLAANCAAAKDAAAAAGAIPRLAALLGGSADVCVRALLGLGMLVGGSPERQLELAAVPGAVSAILRLMRQQDDADVQQVGSHGSGCVNGRCVEAQYNWTGYSPVPHHTPTQISAGLFKELATNAEAKQALGAALKEQQAADAAGAKYV